jgi:hypothetical protein
MPSLSDRVLTASGPRAAEELLLARIEEDQQALRADLRRLARPLYVLVPSMSLRLALQERLASRGAGPALGVEVLTLHRFARIVHERAGRPLPRGEALLPVLVQRLAPAHSGLAALADHRDGLAALVAALRDLQDAGSTPAHREALEDCLAEASAHPGLQRARALLDLATELDAALAAEGCAGAGAAARSTAELLRADAGLARARAVWIHGFQDAPGATSELLEALVERGAARIVFDTLALALPPGPTGTRYGERLAGRLGVPLTEPRTGFVEARVELRFVEALGLRAEARAIATAVRARIAAGVRPERIAIVARSLAGIGRELAGSLRALGVPFSGLSAQGSPTPASRAAHALADLIEQGQRAHVVRALRAGWRVPASIEATEAELLAACGLLGATRLAALAQLDLAAALGGQQELRLPGGRGRARSAEEPERDVEEDDEPREENEPEPETGQDNRRLVPRAALVWIQGQARDWSRSLAALPTQGRLAQFLPAFLSLARAQFPALEELATAAARALAEALPEELRLSSAEFLELAAAALREAPRSPLGGAGSGVQLLDALEARSRSFDELFLVDLCQGVFPRSVREEPLLPDRLRSRLLAVLPDLPVKTAALAEEEALFVGLLAGAPRATLSWTRADEEGRSRSPSPFLRRVWRERHGSELVAGRAPLASFAARRAGDPERVELACSEYEELARIALRGPAALAAALPELLAAEGRPAALAEARCAVLAELEPARARPAYPNAYLGSVGASAHAGDGRKDEPWVSALEALANCPWQMFLGRVLSLAPAVPVRDLGALLEPAHVGLVVHAVLSAIVQERGAKWPDDAGVRELCAGAAQALVRSEHLAPAGIARVLALRAQGFLDVARRLDAQGTGRLRAEISGRLAIDPQHTLPFRADRVESRPEGDLWIDFKTSRRPLSEGVKLDTREKHMRAAARAGQALQAAAYAFAAPPPATGRYVYLHPRIDDELRLQDASAADPELRRGFDEALARLYAAWDTGAFPPRLVAPSLRAEHKGCKSCDFQAACQRGDSGMRRRTVEWLRQDELAPQLEGISGAIQGLWRLKRPPKGAPQ